MTNDDLPITVPPTVNHPDSLDRMMILQHRLQERLAKRPGAGPAPHFSAGDRNFLLDDELEVLEAGVQFNCRAMFHEVAELEDWTRWKAWSNQLGNKVSIEVGSAEHLKEMRLEAIDLMHFLMNIFAWLGMNHHDIYELYLEKNATNFERQESGSY